MWDENYLDRTSTGMQSFSNHKFHNVLHRLNVPANFAGRGLIRSVLSAVSLRRPSSLEWLASMRHQATTAKRFSCNVRYDVNWLKLFPIKPHLARSSKPFGCGLQIFMCAPTSASLEQRFSNRGTCTRWGAQRCSKGCTNFLTVFITKFQRESTISIHTFLRACDYSQGVLERENIAQKVHH